MSFNNSDKFVVGDALQALYAFRGADSSIIKNLAEDSDWKTYVLRKNYRSGSNICNFANMNTSYANDSYRIILESTRDGGFVNVIHSHGRLRHRGDLMDYNAMDTLLSITKLPGSSAILARTNQEVSDISHYLLDKGIDINKTDDNTDIKILKSVSDKEYMLRWLSSSLPNDMYANYIRLSGKDDDYDIIKFLDDFKTDYINKMTKRINEVSSIIDEETDPTTTMFSLISYLKLSNLPETNLTCLNDLIEFLENKSENCFETNLYVGTIHSSKGLEYDNVCLYGVGGPSFQLTNEENCNVYYVGITRAKNVLYVLEG
jgi:DNA helicase-2/ATP-dependent DNA helicase PcrA